MSDAPEATPTTSVEVDAQAQIVWDYHLLHHQLQPSDCLLILGSNDPRVAEHGAQLFLKGWAPWLIVSGGVGALTQGLYDRSEAEHFADIAIKMGVPIDRILIEPRSTNTGENIQYTRQLLSELGLAPASVILVQKPFMERRSFATFRQQWPGPDIVVSSPPISYADYPNKLLSRDDVINVMVGDLQRIREYPRLGYQIPQDIPDHVWSAFETLVEWGFDKHLMSHDSA